MREYLISVTTVAIICSSIYAFFHKKTTCAAVIKLLCGIVLSISVLGPVVDFSINDFLPMLHVDTDQIQAVVAEGEATSLLKQQQIISQQLTTYIENKAREYGCEVKVSITLSLEPPYVPEKVELSGSVSPYAKSAISEWLKQTVGIDKGAQVWIG